MKKKSAFTLIELIVTISIIALISTVVFVSLSGSKQKERDAKKISDVLQLQTALENYKRAEGVYPSTITLGQPLVGSTTGITFLSKVPEASIGEDCGADQYSYSYSSTTKEYSFSFCINNDLEDYTAGVYAATPKGIKAWVCGDNLVDSRDGQEYSTAQIGTQCWMTENFNYDSGCASIPWVNAVDSGWCGCYNNDSNNCATYGKLYTWSAAMASSTIAGAQGICPSGWHIPTESEQYVLYNYVNSIPEYRCEGAWYSIAKALASKSGWNTSTVSCAVGNNQGSNNISGFSAFPGGSRNGYGGSFGSINQYFYFLSSSKGSSVKITILGYNSNLFGNDGSSYTPASSVRCLKD